MASSKVPERAMKAVATAFFNMHTDPKGKEILRQASLKVGLPADTFFIPSNGAEYASYRKFYQSAPALLR
jgi:phosphonate transport system substrate-binding protein